PDAGENLFSRARSCLTCDVLSVTPLCFLDPRTLDFSGILVGFLVQTREKSLGQARTVLGRKCKKFRFESIQRSGHGYSKRIGKKLSIRLHRRSLEAPRTGGGRTVGFSGERFAEAGSREIVWRSSAASQCSTARLKS